MGEKMALMENPYSLILRSAAIYGPGSPVLKWAKETLERDGVLEAYAGAYSSPTYVGDLAEAMKRCIEQKVTGIHHFAGPQKMHRHQFFSACQRRFGWPGEVTRSMEHGNLPKDVSLRSVPTYTLLSYVPRGLEECLREMETI